MVLQSTQPINIYSLDSGVEVQGVKFDNTGINLHTGGVTIENIQMLSSEGLYFDDRGYGLYDIKVGDPLGFAVPDNPWPSGLRWGQGTFEAGQRAFASRGSVAMGNFVTANNGSIMFGDDPRLAQPTGTPPPEGWPDPTPTLQVPPSLASDEFGNGINVFAARATGGVTFVTGVIEPPIRSLQGTITTPGVYAGVTVPSGAGAWDTLSDVNSKTDWKTVDPELFLRGIAGMNIKSWRYQAQSEGIRHVGPTAQDFRAAFGLGTSEKTISTVDADGASMLAIQALAKRTDELRAATQKIEELEKRLAAIEALLTAPRRQQ
jgi:hypothetical protein